MSRVKSRDTTPERRVRRVLTDLGYRYRLQDRSLPGRPDLVFKGRRKVIFVHGCFWHGCTRDGCRGARLPKSNTEYWVEKRSKNMNRDQRVLNELAAMGWSSLVVWECELSELEALAERLRGYLGPVRLAPYKRKR